MNDPLDELMTALRSPALPTELEGRHTAVDAIHQILVDHAEAPLPVPSIPSRRRLPAAAMMAAGVLGFAGVAAAGPGGLLTNNTPRPTISSTAPETTVETATQPSTTMAPTTVPPTTVLPTTLPATTVPATTVPATTVPPTTATAVPTTAAAAIAPAASPDDVTGASEPVDDLNTAFDETQCAEGNHGRTVSSVAGQADPGPGHGAQVRDAAQSSCGKTASGAGADRDSTEAEAEAEAEDKDKDKDKVQDRGKGAGKQNGKSKSSD